MCSFPVCRSLRTRLIGQALIYFAVDCVTGCGWVFDCGLRSDIRSRYKIAGGGCTDCVRAPCGQPDVPARVLLLPPLRSDADAP